MDPAVARIIDANANRAREALRVIEDHARFVLDDRAVSAAVKSLRHDLVAVLSHESFRDILRARDTEHDVGRSIATEAEYRRDDAGDVAAAAVKRAGEALRTLEEYAKTTHADSARAFERLRYRLYETERVVVRDATPQRFRRVKLYVLLTEAFCAGDWLDTARRAIEGGADGIQLREKSLPDAVLLDRARRLANVCRDAGVLFIVNDRPDIARLVRADGVHVGQDDLSVADVRRIMPPRMLVGVSAHTIEQARGAAAVSPDYIALGPMFPSATKPQDHVPGPALLAAMRAETSIPLVPIGGINRTSLAAVLQAGAERICVCSAVIGAVDVADAARALKTSLRVATETAGPAGAAVDGS